MRFSSRLVALKQDPWPLTVLAFVLAIALGVNVLAPVAANADTGATVTGTVVGASDEPLQSQHVYLYKYDVGEDDYNYQAEAGTNASGQYTFTGLPAGQYKLWVYSGNGHLGEWYNNAYSAASATVFTVPEAGAVVLDDIQLSLGATLSGAVVGYDGQPLEGQSLVVYKYGLLVGDTTRYGWDALDKVETNEAGQYEFTGLTAGQYTVNVRPGNGYIDTWYDGNYGSPSFTGEVSFPVADFEQVTLPEFRPGLAATLSGTVLLSHGEPLVESDDRTIQLRMWTGTYWSYSYSTSTDADGQFIFQDLSPGQYKLYVNNNECLCGTVGGENYYVASFESQWYNNKATIDEADTINLSIGETYTTDTITVIAKAVQSPSVPPVVPVQPSAPPVVSDPVVTSPPLSTLEPAVVETPTPATLTAPVPTPPASTPFSIPNASAKVSAVKAPKSVKAGKKARVSLTVKSSKATKGATVTVKLGAKTIAKPKVTAKGKVSFTINTKKLKLKKGKTYSFKVQYQGNNVTNKSKVKTIKIKVK